VPVQKARCTSLQMYMFLDERVEAVDPGSRLIVGCVVCEKLRWDDAASVASEIGALGARRRLHAIDSFLRQVRGFALLGYADLPGSVLAYGERDATADIPRMSRTNNLWSQLFLCDVAAALAWIRRSGITQASLHVHYDPRDITEPHRRAMREVLDVNLASIATEDPDTAERDPSLSYDFPEFEEVPKPEPGQTPNTKQHGTAIAHHLCTQSSRVIERGGLGSVRAVNHIESVAEITRGFLQDQSENGAG